MVAGFIAGWRRQRRTDHAIGHSPGPLFMLAIAFGSFCVILAFAAAPLLLHGDDVDESWMWAQSRSGTWV
jgi:hypothetical protein